MGSYRMAMRLIAGDPSIFAANPCHVETLLAANIL